MEPLVTIAIPTYNRAESYLPQAIQSALNQTYSNIEILVSDNCSTDNTTAVVKSFNDPRIKFFQQEKNIGSNNNANFCLAQATGKFFLLFFDDDQIDSDFIEVCMKAMNKGNDNAGVVFTGAREIDSKGNILFECPNQGMGLSTEEFILAWFDGKVPLYFCSTLFNTKKLREIGGLHSKTNMYEDVVAEIRLSKMFGSITIRDVKASYRRHGHNMGSSVPIRAWCEDSLFLLDVMCHLASEKKI